MDKNRLLDALENLDRPLIEEIFREALLDSQPIGVVEGLIVPALEEMGSRWSEGSVALSQIYMASRICEELVTRILPATPPQGRVRPAIAIAVLHDYHLLGKRIVLAVMRASGFDMLDYGRMETEALVERIIADDVRILMISVLMLPAALRIRQVVEMLKKRGWNGKIAVGGAPFLFDPDLWREVGADAMGKNASDAISIVRKWMEEAG
ncbi:MAG: cobalamin-binding protein [Burkholderiales bacterium]|nr:cobalamin-binding protein [Burkholderiales bacterium]